MATATTATTTAASAASSSPSSSSWVPVGLDLSSFYARVAVDGRRQGVVSNTQGDRFTLALIAREESGDFVVGEAGLRFWEAGTSNTATTTTTTTTVARLIDADDDAAQAYLKYLIQLAADNAAVTVDQLRIVLTCPVPSALDAVDSVNTTATTTHWIDRVNRACKGLILDKKKRKEDAVVGVITKAVATCLAQHHQPSPTNVDGSTILIADMDGDSSLQLTVMAVTSAGVYVQLSSVTVEGVSGPELLTLLSTHVATHFERQNKLSRGEVLSSKKAKAKLLKEAQRVLLSGGGTGGAAGSGAAAHTMTVMIDGLYEGMDCNVTISKPRWELMTAPLITKVETALNSIDLHTNIDKVLISGAWATTFLKLSMEKVFGDKLAVGSVAPEEAVVLGCAKQAGWNLAKPGLSWNTTDVEVPISPVAIGIGDDNVVLIPLGTPLPAKIRHVLAAPTKVYQLLGGATASTSTATTSSTPPSKIELAHVTDVHEVTTMIVELSVDGQLSIGISGQPLVVV